ncbi:MAG: hypothetical protein JSV64_04575 [Candidatus Bathyarchaeota archaeon]|nr:MAG: hypothetical protein JSV64_04575 [Candidatus Bathyarchaeota archaeon]
MRRVSLCLVQLALAAVLILASSVGIEAAFCFPDVTVTPTTPTIADNVNLTVSYFFSTWPPFVESFGPFVQAGNTFSVNVTVYFPTPSEVVLMIVHTDSQTYNLGNLPVGEYRFKVYIQRIHYMEGFFLAEIIDFNITFRGDIDHDLDVDIYDAVKCGIAYGSTPSSPNWNPHCDIAEPYERIDIFDLVTIAANYGEEYTL